MAEKFEDQPAPGLVSHVPEEDSLSLILGVPPGHEVGQYEDRLDLLTLNMSPKSGEQTDFTAQAVDADGTERQALYTACLETLWTLALN
jgi:hypothetical protein